MVVYVTLFPMLPHLSTHSYAQKKRIHAHAPQESAVSVEGCVDIMGNPVGKPCFLVGSPSFCRVLDGERANSVGATMMDR